MAITMDLIRPMTARDVEPAADLLRREGFGERLTFLTWALDQPTISLFLAEHDGRIVGTGVGSAHGNAGWVGVIFVTPDRRGNGLGRQITRTVLDALEARGCRTQVLLASPLGRPIYEREGFTVLDRHVRVSADGLAPDVGPPGPGIRRFAADDLAGVLALDRHVTGEDRAAVLRPVLSSATTFVAVDGAGAVSGYLARAPWRGGALIALDPGDAIRLLEIRRHATGTSGHAGAGVLAGNVVGRERLRAAGWVEELGGFRMIRGEPLDWRPNAIWGLLNGALG